MMQQITRVFTRLLGSGVGPHATHAALGVGRARGAASLAKQSLAKQRHVNVLTAVSGFAKLGGPGRVAPGKFGDDAYFVARTSAADVIGVADGVGGWREMGIDPGEFSTRLMSTCQRLLEDGSYSGACSKALLCMAYEELKRAKEHVLGSSTACVVMIHAEAAASPRVPPASALSKGRLASANIGDSGVLVVRRGAVVFRSQEQTHYFNTPYQLSVPPPGSGQDVLSDLPSDAQAGGCEMVAGDLVLVATDGVFDNLPEEALLAAVAAAEGTCSLAVLEQAADQVARLAKKYSEDGDFISPFAENAAKNNLYTRGGKPDDITVVLAAVVGLDQG